MRRFSYPFLQGQRGLQGPIWSSEGETVPADRMWEVITLANSLKDERVIKEAGEEEWKKNGTDGRLLSSN